MHKLFQMTAIQQHWYNGANKTFAVQISDFICLGAGSVPVAAECGLYGHTLLH